MKRPAFQFYPADWRKDVELQSCSMAAQGLWINLLCVAHECEPYGHLAVNGKPMNSAQIGRQVGLSAKEAEALLRELEDNGVARRTPEGVIYSHRMVKDERLRNIRAESGRLGGNPNLLAGKVNQNDNQSLTPSSSSSSSTSVNTEEPTVLVGKASPTRPPDCPTGELLSLYHQHLPMLPRVEIVNDGRKRALSARWREVVTDPDISKSPDPRAAALDWFAWFFGHVAGSKFLTGRAKDWKADFDFLMTPSKFAKVVEGSYHKEAA